MRRRHLVIFCKAPRFGAVKTRLAADIGRLEALRFYRTTLERLTRELGGDPRWRLWLAVTPDRFAQDPGLWPPGIPRIPQGPGALGQRMDRAMRTLPRGPALIIGSDIPAIDQGHIETAFRQIERAGSVIGPAGDGGYWCVGLSRLLRVPRIFDGVEWSSGRELDQTLENMRRAGLSPFVTETLADIDTGEDLASFRPGWRN